MIIGMVLADRLTGTDWFSRTHLADKSFPVGDAIFPQFSLLARSEFARKGWTAPEGCADGRAGVVSMSGYCT
jgi:hypothetical protein